jgi:two-component system, OmpR family, response regulator
MRILVIEDDRGMAKLVRLLLTENGYAVDITASGEEGLSLARINPYDALILDLGLPDRAGLTVLRALRAEGSRMPVLILTARAGTDPVVQGLDAGADDYLVKPFANAELQARVRALVRRGGAVRTEQVACGTLVVNRLTRHALVAGRQLELTSREFALLEHLALHAGEVVTRTTLLEAIWDMHFDPGTNVVDALVLRLRRKLAAAGPSPQVETIRGAGYRLSDAAIPDRPVIAEATFD